MGLQRLQGPVPGVKCLGQRLKRADRLRGKAADEKTRLRVDDPAMTSFAVIKHEPHLPFRYGSIIAGAVYNNTDSSGHFRHLLCRRCRKTAFLGGFSKNGGPSDRIRTCGILLPKQAL